MPPTKRQMKKRAANDRKEPNHVRAASHQAATVAAVIAGVDESQKMRNKEVAKDEVIAKAFFGSTKQMGDVTSFDAAGLAANVEDVGKAASEVCGDGDGCSLVDETKSVDQTLIDMKTLFSEMDAGVMLLLKDEKAFENMTGLQVKMRKVVEKKKDLRQLIEALKSAKGKEPAEAARELFQSVKLIESVKFMSSEIVHSEPLWVVFDKDNLESYLKKIDDLIKFEPIHEKIYKFNKQITEMPHQLVPIIKQANFLSKKISEAIHDGFETQLVQMNSVTSSFRSNSVPLRRMLTDFDTTVREFGDMYLEGAGGHGNNGIQIRTILEPIDSLIGEMKTLLPSLESVNVGDDIWEKVQNVGTNTKKAKSEIETLSKVHECAAKVTATGPFKFEKLRFFRRTTEEVQAKQPRDQYNSLLKVASNMPKFDNFYGFFKSNTESNIETEFLKAPPKLIEETLEELEKLDTVFDSFWRTMEDWIGDIILDEAIAKISMKPLVETFECLAKENLLDIPDSGRIIAIPNLKSNNPDMRAAAQLASRLIAPIDQLVSIKSTSDQQRPVTGGKQSVPLKNAADIAAKWHEASRHLQSWADAFDVVSHVVDQAKWEASIDQTSPDPTRPKTIVCWDSDFKKMMKELPKGLHQLNLNVSAPHLNSTLIEKFKVAPQLFRQSADCEIEDLLKELNTVTDTRTRHLLQQLVKLRLSHEEAEKILSEAGATFVPMEQFLKENLDIESSQLTDSNNATNAASCDGTNVWSSPIPYVGLVVGGAVVAFVAVLYVKCYKKPAGPARSRLNSTTADCESGTKRTKKDLKQVPEAVPLLAADASKEAQKKQEKNKDAEEEVIRKKTAENQKKQNEMTSSLKQKMYENRGKSKFLKKTVRGEPMFVLINGDFPTHSESDEKGEVVEEIDYPPELRKILESFLAAQKDGEKLTEECGDPSKWVRTQSPPFFTVSELQQVLDRPLQVPSETGSRWTFSGVLRRCSNADHKYLEKTRDVEDGTTKTSKSITSKSSSKTGKSATPSTKTSKERSERSVDTALSKTASNTQTVPSQRASGGEDESGSQDESEAPPAETARAPHHSFVPLSEIEGDPNAVVKRIGEEYKENADYIEVRCCPGYFRPTKIKPRAKNDEDKEWQRAYMEGIKKASERGERQFAGTDVASNKKDDALVVPKKPEGADPPMDLKIRRIYVRNEFLTDNGTALNIFVLLSTFLTREFREVEGWRELRYRKDKPRHPLHAKEVILVCDAAKALFARQEPLLELGDYHRIYGDVHGCYESLYQLVVGTDGKLLPVPIIILGDIVDRGQRSIDCVLLVCALKLAYPHLVHWIRGNHELVHINSKYGLLAECYGAFGGKEGADVFTAINGLMRSLPMAAILCDKIFVCHGGIYKGFTSRERMKELIKRREEATTKEEIEAATCLLWADPGLYFKGNNANEPAFLPSARGAQGAETFNMAAAEKFCRDCRFDVIIRGHQIPKEGYLRWPVRDCSLITIFSSANSFQLGQTKSKNLAAFIEMMPGNKLGGVQFFNSLTWDSECQWADDIETISEEDAEQMFERERRLEENRKAKRAAAAAEAPVNATFALPPLFRKFLKWPKP